MAATGRANDANGARVSKLTRKGHIFFLGLRLERKARVRVEFLGFSEAILGFRHSPSAPL